MARRLLLHCCCAPCASYVLECLSADYRVTLLFYNPNIKPQEEYEKRAAELQKLLSLAEYRSEVDLIVCEYDASVFDAAASPYMDEPEGGQRCKVCFELRLAKTAMTAKDRGYDCFTTTLSVSPHKDAMLLNEIGERLAGKYGVRYLPSDFKKNNGFKRSVELSKRYGLYRQNYCGCRQSKLR